MLTISVGLVLLVLLGSLPPGLRAQGTATLERVLALPTDPYSGDPSFHEPIDVALNADGDELFVVDNFRRSVRVFDLGGRLLREFGRSGAGPGDLALPTRIDLAPGRVAVDDGRNYRVTWFTPLGEYEGSRQHPDLEPGRPLRQAAVAVPVRHEQLVAETRAAWGRTGGEEPRMEDLVGLVGRDGRMVQALDRFPNGWGYAFYRSSPDYTYPVPGRRRPQVVWDLSGDSLYVSADGYRGLVRWYAIGEAQATVVQTRELGWSPQPAGISDAEVLEMKRQMAEPRGRDPADLEIVLPEFRGALDYFGLTVADNGDVWLRRARYDEEQHDDPSPPDYVVVPFAEDEPVRELTLPVGFSLRSVRGDLLAGVHEEEEFEIATVRVYRLQGWD